MGGYSSYSNVTLSPLKIADSAPATAHQKDTDIGETGYPGSLSPIHERFSHQSHPGKRIRCRSDLGLHREYRSSSRLEAHSREPGCPSSTIYFRRANEGHARKSKCRQRWASLHHNLTRNHMGGLHESLRLDSEEDLTSDEGGVAQEKMDLEGLANRRRAQSRSSRSLHLRSSTISSRVHLILLVVLADYTAKDVTRSRFTNNIHWLSDIVAFTVKKNSQKEDTHGAFIKAKESRNSSIMPRRSHCIDSDQKTAK